MPTGHAWIEKPPRSSSRMNSTHALDSVRPSQEAQTPGDQPMTIRSGGRPRNGRARRRTRTTQTRTQPRASPSTPSLRPADAAAVAVAAWAAACVGLLKFLVFALVLGGVVLALGLTALRPVVIGGGRDHRPRTTRRPCRLPFVAGHGAKRTSATALDRRRSRPIHTRSSSSSRRATRRGRSRPVSSPRA